MPATAWEVQKAAALGTLTVAGKTLQLGNISKGLAEDNKLRIGDQPVAVTALASRERIGAAPAHPAPPRGSGSGHRRPNSALGDLSRKISGSCPCCQPMHGAEQRPRSHRDTAGRHPVMLRSQPLTRGRE